MKKLCLLLLAIAPFQLTYAAFSCDSLIGKWGAKDVTGPRYYNYEKVELTLYSYAKYSGKWHYEFSQGKDTESFDKVNCLFSGNTATLSFIDIFQKSSTISATFIDENSLQMHAQIGESTFNTAIYHKLEN